MQVSFFFLKLGAALFSFPGAESQGRVARMGLGEAKRSLCQINFGLWCQRADRQASWEMTLNFCRGPGSTFLELSLLSGNTPKAGSWWMLPMAAPACCLASVSSACMVGIACLSCLMRGSGSCVPAGAPLSYIPESYPGLCCAILILGPQLGARTVHNAPRLLDTQLL